jgi:hypothetical protein
MNRKMKKRFQVGVGYFFLVGCVLFLKFNLNFIDVTHSLKKTSAPPVEAVKAYDPSIKDKFYIQGKLDTFEGDSSFDIYIPNVKKMGDDMKSIKKIIGTMKQNSTGNMHLYYEALEDMACIMEEEGLTAGECQDLFDEYAPQLAKAIT